MIRAEARIDRLEAGPPRLFAWALMLQFDLAVAPSDPADGEGVEAAPAEMPDDRVAEGRADNQDIADAHVEDVEHLTALHPDGLEVFENRRHIPTAGVNDRSAVLGQDANDVTGQAAAGDVGHAPDNTLDAIVAQQLDDRAYIYPRGLEQLHQG